jgi:hypothetical protein
VFQHLVDVQVLCQRVIACLHGIARSGRDIKLCMHCRLALNCKQQSEGKVVP